jgi:hypothetical protein
MNEDLSHDPHLRAALRHAPDHALAPPAGVSQTILNAARQVHRPSRPAATPAPAVRITVAQPRVLAWLRHWLASPRLAGGLATGLVAALGLGLWFDLDQELVIDRAPLQSPSQVRTSDAAPATAPAAEPGAASANDARDARSGPTAPAAPADAPRAKRLPRAGDANLERDAQTTPAQRQAAAAPPAEAERRADSTAAREAEVALALRTPQAVPPPATPTPMPATEPAPAVAQAVVDAQQREAASKSASRMSLAAGRAAAVAGERASAVDTAGAADAAAAASPALALLRRARSEPSGSGGRWAWTPPGSPLMAPFDDTGQAWLARVMQASRGRWTDVNERAGAGDAIEVRWWRDDWPQATLRIEAEGVRWIEHGGRIRYAPLDAATLQRLRSR